MSDDLLRELRARVDAIVRPHIDLHGDEFPPVRMALRILAEAEDIAAGLAARKVPTDRAAELTHWHPETLQKYARAKIAGRAVPVTWEGIEVEETPGGYLFVIGSIPEKPRRVA